MTNQVYVSILIIATLFVCGYLMVHNKSEPYDNQSKADVAENVPCVCAFDLDGTVTCGDPHPALELCAAKGCKIAVNTARPLPVLTDIQARGVKFPKSIYEGEDVYYNPKSYSSTSKQVGEYKASVLEKLAKKYHVDNKRCVLLIDDMIDNVKACISEGFSAIKCSDRQCGIDDLNMSELHKILSNCNQSAQF